MIVVSKLVIALVWVFWLISSGSVADGNPADQAGFGKSGIKLKTEYTPTYSSTYDRVKKRGYVICGTNDDFPGFSEEIWTEENGDIWTGFDVDICRSVAASVIGDTEAIEYVIFI